MEFLTGAAILSTICNTRHTRSRVEEEYMERQNTQNREEIKIEEKRKRILADKRKKFAAEKYELTCAKNDTKVKKRELIEKKNKAKNITIKAYPVVQSNSSAYTMAHAEFCEPNVMESTNCPIPSCPASDECIAPRDACLDNTDEAK